MIKEIRQNKILELLEGKEISPIDTISDELKIPLTTLRRDLIDLEKQMKLVRLHGGIKLIKQDLKAEDFLENKLQTNIDQKKSIAKLASKKIKPNTSIFLDAGSSIYYLAKILDPILNLTIVTNSIINVEELTKKGHKNIYLLGGKFTNVTGAILGYEAIEALKNYSFDMSFIGANAIDNNGNIYTTNSDHAQIKVEIIKNSSKVFALVDDSKFNSKSFYKFAKTSQENLKIIS